MNCLRTETLERLALDFLPDDGPARDHVASCDACRRELSLLRNEHAALAGAARIVAYRGSSATRRPLAFLWKPLAWALAVHAVLLAGLVALYADFAEKPGEVALLPDFPIQLQRQGSLLQDLYRPREVFERRAMPVEGLDDPLFEAAPVFFPEARESDHCESADREVYHPMKGDSAAELSYAKGQVVPHRGRSTGAYSTLCIGSGGGSGGYSARSSKGSAGPDRRLLAKGYRPLPTPEGDGGMMFKDQGANPIVPTTQERQSTFGLDVDTASYTKVRNFLLLGALPPKEAVRVEECVNYIRYADPLPPPGKFSIRLEAAPSPFNEGRHVLRIAIQSREPAKEERPRVILTFVIDVSGSMGTDNRLGLVKRSLGFLLDQLRADDQVGIVVYGSNGRRLLDPTPVVEKERILGVIQSLRTEGATNLEAGVDIGYDLAATNFDPKAANRVVICTDGVANNGVTDPITLLQNVKEKASKGIWLSVFGFGMSNYNDHLMMTLADKGNGSYAYIDDFQEATKAFTQRLGGLFDVAAADAKVQVEFNPATVESYRLLGYEKRKLQNEDFRDDKVDAGELSAGHHVTALYEMTLKSENDGRLAAVRMRYRVPATKEVVEIEETIAGSQVRKTTREASPSFRLAATVAQFAEILRGSPYATTRTFDPILEQALSAASDLGRPEDATEFVALIRQAIKLSKK